MPRRHLSAVLVAVLCLALVPASAAASTKTLGNALVHRFLALVKDRDAGRLGAFLSPAFQIQRADGSRAGRAAYLAALPIVKSYRVRGLEATRNGDLVVATYEVASNQVIDGKPFKAGFAPRISTFQRAPGGWQIVSHANFNTPQ
jgi:hypothetical protein